LGDESLRLIMFSLAKAMCRSSQRIEVQKPARSKGERLGEDAALTSRVLLQSQGFGDESHA
jgi:hypothetical protein